MESAMDASLVIALRNCRNVLTAANTSETRSPLLYRACMCANGQTAFCSGIVTQREVSAGSDASDPDSGRLVGLRGDSVYPLCAVAVLICLGMICMIYAYRNRRRLEMEALARSAAMRGAESDPEGGLTTPEAPLHSDAPPPYSSVQLDAPPPYEKVCKLGEPQQKPASSSCDV